MRFPFLILALLATGLSYAQSSWYSSAIIDLRVVTSSYELSEIISAMTSEFYIGGEDQEQGSFNCHYRSYVSEAYTDENVLEALIAFEFSRDSELCGNGEEGIKRMWKKISSLPHVTLGEITQK